MNISNLNGVFENSDDPMAMNLIKFTDKNNISWLNLNDVLIFRKDFKDKTGFNLSGKWNVIGNLNVNSPFIVLKKISSKNENTVNISYDILKEYKDQGLIYEA